MGFKRPNLNATIDSHSDGEALSRMRLCLHFRTRQETQHLRSGTPLVRSANDVLQPMHGQAHESAINTANSIDMGSADRSSPDAKPATGFRGHFNLPNTKVRVVRPPL